MYTWLKNLYGQGGEIMSPQVSKTCKMGLAHLMWGNSLVEAPPTIQKPSKPAILYHKEGVKVTTKEKEEVYFKHLVI